MSLSDLSAQAIRSSFVIGVPSGKKNQVWLLAFDDPQVTKNNKGAVILARASVYLPTAALTAASTNSDQISIFKSPLLSAFLAKLK